MLTEGLTLKEAAKYLNKHVRTLQKWDTDGVLPAFRTKTIIHCFSSRLYGLCNYKKEIKEHLQCK